MTKDKDLELEVVKTYVKNLMKSNEDHAPKGGSECNSNCDCYIELEATKAAGIAGYRYGS